MRATAVAGSARREEGFTLLELIVAVGIAALLAAVASLAVQGFADTGTSARCRADTLRLREAETTYFVAHDRYADETELVAAALLAAPSDLHDVVLPGAAYAITEVGPCIGQGSAYGIAAPTVGTTDHSGTTVAVVAPDGSGVAGVAVSYQGSGDPSWTTMGMTDRARSRDRGAYRRGIRPTRRVRGRAEHALAASGHQRDAGDLSSGPADGAAPRRGRQRRWPAERYRSRRTVDRRARSAPLRRRATSSPRCFRRPTT